MGGIAPLAHPEALSRGHDVSQFDCGRPELNDWLKRFALQASTRTFVTSRANVVVGYYGICTGSIDHQQASVRVGKGQGRYPIPVVLLARLAVDKSVQGIGVGRSLLLDALSRYMAIEAHVGVRALVVHAKDAVAANYYEKFGFEPSPIDALHLMMLTKDIKATVAQAGQNQPPVVLTSQP